MSQFNFSPQNFGLRRNYLYETITTTYSIDDKIGIISPNASCMGIRLEENDKIIINPYPSTTTYKNLRENRFVALNFVNDVYLYALAALKDPNSLIGLTEFPLKYYGYQYLESFNMDIPYIKKAWAILIGKVSKEFQKTRQDSLGEMMIPVFMLDIIFARKLKETHKLFNRAENLALEMIILATRLKIAKNNNNQTLFSKTYKIINYYKENIKRFGKNKKSLKTIELVNIYINKLMD
ncbi:MAG: DUF447 domain-containing protein [Promethearchaeota archaeon]